ncbi:SIR2 family protein [Sorangium sp. So ce136]|uniref:SIR2 family NAD-dependent protein deacylase n=1 Tax=Sorangium sp. So ce136 TaxID=3133284 RepID=UPI003F0A2B60
MAQDFPDLAHLRQLRALLWSDASRGGASVMVGAGMSRNATPLRADQPRMPLWGDLCANMAKETWGSDGLRRGADALLVAEYFERVHGRTALDDFLRRQIRDNEFTPSRLHILLMALPWADVFTTNYDTLLERASRKVIERRYEVLVNESDLANSKQPRIVKLNGSFPSHRPLIITKEDFRTYPSRFPAFVNTVQQAIMETALCMIGFSGDDPNFEAWAGWVRDNLGSAAPPLYLCGILDLDIARRSYYEARNIKPINLAPLFPISEWGHGDARHAAAMEWLILSLAEGAPVNSMLWPQFERRLPALPMAEMLRVPANARQLRPTRGMRPDAQPATPAAQAPSAWSPSAGLPAVLPGEELPGSYGHDKNDVQRILGRASLLQRTYPGWLIATEMTMVSHEVLEWFKALKATPSTDLEVVHAVAWGLDVLQWPFPEEVVTRADELINASPTVAPRPEIVTLLRWLIREAREEDDHDAFRRRMEILAKMARNNTVLATEWWLEQAKFHFMRLELDEMESALSHVPSQPGSPFVDVIRASLLFEIGQFREAAELSIQAVDEIRRNAPREAMSMRSLGEEASALDLVMNSYMSLEFGFSSAGTGYQRRDELRRSGADPRVELEILGAELAKVAPPPRYIAKEFDPNQYTERVKHTFGNDHLHPFKYLRALEAAAQLPHNHAEHVSLAARAVANERPGLAFASLIRASRKLDEAFPRHVVLELRQESIEALSDRCESFLRSLLDGREVHFDIMDSFLKRATEGAIDLLSRLTLRSDVARRRRCLAMAVSLHEAEFIRSHWPMHAPVGKLFERLFLSMSLDELAEALPAIVAMTIPGTGGTQEVWDQMWHEPCKDYLDIPLGNRLMGHRAMLASRAHALIAIAGSANGLPRSIAVCRLEALRAAGGLDETALQAYADAVWNNPHDGEGIPDVQNFLLNFGLQHPAEKAREKFTAWALRTPLPPLFVSETVAGQVVERSQAHWDQRHIRSLVNGTVFPMTTEQKRQRLVDWSPSEALALLEHVVRWLDDARNKLASSKFFMDRELSVVADAGQFVASVIVPRAELSLSMAHLDAMDRALADMKLLTLREHPTWLIVDPTQPVADGIRIGLTSLDEATVQRTAPLVFEWLMYSAAHRIPEPPEDILDHLVSLATGGPDRSKLSALFVLFNVAFHYPDALNPLRRHRLELLCRSVFRTDPVDASAGFVPRIDYEGDYRAAVAEIGWLLAIRNGMTSEPLRKCLELASADVYPEVRRACENVREKLAEPVT